MSSSRDPGSSAANGGPQAPYDLEQNLEKLKALYARFQRFAKCRECRASVASPSSGLTKHVKLWRVDTRSGHPLEAASFSCQQCSAFTCIGCGQNPVTTSPSVSEQHRCGQGRLFAIWNLLARFDEEEAKLKAKPMKTSSKASPSTSQSTPGKAKFIENISTMGESRASGVGYGGNGYGDWDEYDSDEDDYLVVPELMGVSKKGKSKQKFLPKITDQEENQNSLDGLVMTTLQLLTPLLDETYSSSEAQLHGEPEELCLLRLSSLFDLVCDLMRNDSIADMTKKVELYQAAFAFVQAIASESKLSKILFEERRGKKQSPGLRALADERGRRAALICSSSSLTSLFACCKETYIQAKAFKVFADKAASVKRSNFGSQNKQSIELCESMISLYDRMQQIESSDQSLIINNIDPWKKYCSENRVTFTDEILKAHKFSDQFSKKKATLKSGQMGTVGREIANMTTSLPDGIFLKVSEERSDVMKALIVGADSSPYAGGLFVFDLFLDANYPESPPKVNFSLNEGRDCGFNMGFNPNLHYGGSVCLSLLNTWQGSPEQMWQPNRSTILSVLISIQAMILGAPYPYYNEPGYDVGSALLGSGPAVEYNMKIQCKTVWYAMIFWLEAKNKEKTAVWHEVKEAYWKHHGDLVIDQVRSWAKENKRILDYDPVAYDAYNPYPFSPASKTKSKGKGLGNSDQNGMDLLQLLGGLLRGEGEQGPTTLTERTTRTGRRADRAKVNETSSTPSKKRKAATSLGSSSTTKKHYKKPKLATNFDDPDTDMESEESGGSDETADYAVLSKSTKPGRAFTHNPKLEHKKQNSSTAASAASSDPSPQWVYSGERTRTETKEACLAFDVKPARSIAESISRLEATVNEEGKGDDHLRQKWGSYQRVNGKKKLDEEGEEDEDEEL